MTLANSTLPAPIDPITEPALSKSIKVIECRVEKGELRTADLKLYNQLLYHAEVSLRQGVETIYSIPISSVRGTHESNDRLKESLLRMQSAKVVFDYFRRGHRALGSAVLLSEFYFNEGRLIYGFPTLIPKLFLEKGMLAPIRLRYVERLRSKYSIRLYEHLQVRIREEQPWRVWPSRLMEVLDVEDSMRKRFSNFAQRALRPAVKEINNLTELHVAFAYDRDGQKVSAVEFKIRRKTAEEEAEVERVCAPELPAAPLLDVIPAGA